MTTRQIKEGTTQALRILNPLCRPGSPSAPHPHRKCWEHRMCWGHVLMAWPRTSGPGLLSPPCHAPATAVLGWDPDPGTGSVRDPWPGTHEPRWSWDSFLCPRPALSPGNLGAPPLWARVGLLPAFPIRLFRECLDPQVSPCVPLATQRRPSQRQPQADTHRGCMPASIAGGSAVTAAGRQPASQVGVPAMLSRGHSRCGGWSRDTSLG